MKQLQIDKNEKKEKKLINKQTELKRLTQSYIAKMKSNKKKTFFDSIS